MTSFEERIIECIDRGMAPLGRSCTRAILWHIEKNSRMKLSDIPSKPELFVEALEDILGPGAITVERMIVKQVNSEFGIVGMATGLEEAIARARKVSE